MPPRSCLDLRRDVGPGDVNEAVKCRRFKQRGSAIEALGGPLVGSSLLSMGEPGRGGLLIRVALFSSPSAELIPVRAVLLNPLRYFVREFLLMPRSPQEIATFPMDVMVLRYPRVEDKHVSNLVQLRALFPHAGIIVLAREVVPAARARVGTLQRTRLLEEPSEISDLASVIDLLMDRSSSAARLHPRGTRAGRLELTDRLGCVHSARFIDFAQMGARVSLASSVPLKKDEVVQIAYPSTADGKIHRLVAKIAWTEKQSGIIRQWTGLLQQTAGLRFIASY